VYLGLAVVIVAAIFPYYWSFLIGSGDASTLNDPNMSWIPGGNFIANAITVMNNPAVNFWPHVELDLQLDRDRGIVVVFSTLAGWAFAKLRFRGSKGLLIFVVATLAVPTQLGVVPLYILFADLGWTGKIGAIIVPSLTSAFGVFWMTQYLSQTVPDELIEAARVDGASMIRTFWTGRLSWRRVPRPRCCSSSPSSGAWNQFFWPFIVLDRQSPTLPVALSLLQSNYFVDYSIVLAGVLLATIPAAHPVRLRRQAARERHHGRRGKGLSETFMTTETRENSALMTLPRENSRRPSSSEPPPPPSRSKAPPTRTDAATRSGIRSPRFPVLSSTPTTATSRAIHYTSTGTTSRS
jgi:cellobiose transport system permease protein